MIIDWNNLLSGLFELGAVGLFMSLFIDTIDRKIKVKNRL